VLHLCTREYGNCFINFYVILSNLFEKLNSYISPGISRKNFVNYILAFVGGKLFKISMKIGVNVSPTSVSKENSEYT
jgi:hypothetical protein